MKLPTLNIDVAVNTKTMQKGIAEAQKNLEKVGKKGLGFAGGTFGKIGSLAELGGGFAPGAIGAGGLALAAMAPIKTAGYFMDTFNEAVKHGVDAMNTFARTGKMTGNLDFGTASRLAAAQQMNDINQVAGGGFMDTFIGAAMNQQGQMGGLQGWIGEWKQATLEGTKWLSAFVGALVGGNEANALDIADQSISRSAAGAQAYMTQDQIDFVARQNEKRLKAEREQNT